MPRPPLSLPLLTFVALTISNFGCDAKDPAPKTTEVAQPGTANPAPKPLNTTMNKEELRQKLTPEQFQVTCENGTEPPFRNAYWDNKEAGIYVDVINGAALFASVHKFDSGSGWPSFTATLQKDAVVEKKDASHGMVRIEARAAKSDAHLGHVFDDGPKAAGGLRYCINSASLKFIPVAKLKEAGYAEYLPMFEKKAGEPAKPAAK